MTIIALPTRRDAEAETVGSELCLQPELQVLHGVFKAYAFIAEPGTLVSLPTHVHMRTCLPRVYCAKAPFADDPEDAAEAPMECCSDVLPCAGAGFLLNSLRTAEGRPLGARCLLRRMRSRASPQNIAICA